MEHTAKARPESSADSACKTWLISSTFDETGARQTRRSRHHPRVSNSTCHAVLAKSNPVGMITAAHFPTFRFPFAPFSRVSLVLSLLSYIRGTSTYNRITWTVWKICNGCILVPMASIAFSIQSFTQRQSLDPFQEQIRPSQTREWGYLISDRICPERQDAAVTRNSDMASLLIFYQLFYPSQALSFTPTSPKVGYDGWPHRKGALFAAGFADTHSGFPWIREAFASRRLYYSSFCSSCDLNSHAIYRRIMQDLCQAQISATSFDMIRLKVFPCGPPQTFDFPEPLFTPAYLLPTSFPAIPRDLRTLDDTEGGDSSLVSPVSDPICLPSMSSGCYQRRLG